MKTRPDVGFRLKKALCQKRQSQLNKPQSNQCDEHGRRVEPTQSLRKSSNSLIILWSRGKLLQRVTRAEIITGVSHKKAGGRDSVQTFIQKNLPSPPLGTTSEGLCSGAERMLVIQA